MILLYIVAFLALGFKNSFPIAILLGLSRFIPYIGKPFAIIIAGLAAVFQPSNYLGLPRIYFLLAVIGTILLLQIIDEIIEPPLQSQLIQINPAAQLVAAIIIARLIGVVGLVLVAPVLATIQLVTIYCFRKVFDLEPWPDGTVEFNSQTNSWWDSIRLRTGDRILIIKNRFSRDKQLIIEQPDIPEIPASSGDSDL